MKVVFFGTPIFSAEILKDLIGKGLDIVAVVTQPDKLQGRHLKLQEPAVKKMAKLVAPCVPIIQPEKISTQQFYEQIELFNADLFVVVAFGQIFPVKLLEMPRLGCVNVHTSLLPKYRGAAPIERCLIDGEAVTGVSVMYMVKALDAGDVLATKKVEILPEMNAQDLTIELCKSSKDILYPTLLKLNEGKIHPIAQNDELVTYAKKITQKDAEISWDFSSIDVYNQYRGVTPKPGAWCFCEIRGKKTRIKLIEIILCPLKGKPGEILSYDEDGIALACADGSIKIKRLQIEGKKAVCSSEFIKGYSSKDVSFNIQAL
ncbi:MAG: Methionyl-tRNA formyltransferase [Chlamydiae bacterium]|nr:Methionyl-tRNA formyltransferase [Chlamydiota bacterium]